MAHESFGLSNATAGLQNYGARAGERQRYLAALAGLMLDESFSIHPPARNLVMFVP
jgi:hypothetical protein